MHYLAYRCEALHRRLDGSDGLRAALSQQLRATGTALAQLLAEQVRCTFYISAVPI